MLIVKSHGLAYFPIPKVANTTIRYGIWEAVGYDDLFDNGNKRMSARLREMSSGMHRFVVVRDPIERALSGWSNRVIHERDIERSSVSRALLAPLGLEALPDANTFFLNIGKYMLVNNRVRRHLLPQASYLGDDLSFFDDIYRIDELDRLNADLAARIGKPINFGRFQTGGPKIRFSDLSRPAAEALLRHLEPDYKILAGYYSPKPLPNDSERPAA